MEVARRRNGFLAPFHAALNPSALDPPVVGVLEAVPTMLIRSPARYVLLEEAEHY
jgi:hypothetical protein